MLAGVCDVLELRRFRTYQW